MYAVLEEKRQRLMTLCQQRPDTMMGLRRQLDAEWTFQEMAMSGTPLARMDVRRMIETRNDPASRVRVLLEAHNFHQATLSLDQLVNKSPQDIREDHCFDLLARLLRGVKDGRAEYRTEPPLEREPGRAIAHDKMSGDLKELFSWLSLPSAQHPVRQATELHLRLAYIQPFAEMNGRMARLLMNLVLMQRGFPPALLNGEDRCQYAEAIVGATKDGGLSLAKLLITSLERSFDFCFDVVEKVPALALAK